ncbi:type II toxin-antitoxin system RelE family toxin [Photobacterium phosphoreum]|uniref:type II toxin-antitoxin system RelE family toxin n=1 Tax=Photobacterium phosphoreum TaxID=659 RepID=UPI00195F9FA6|nr:type II toxin-antitoxin system RelE/ParE family toxin [Photobacterium phosphoreum]
MITSFLSLLKAADLIYQTLWKSISMTYKLKLRGYDSVYKIKLRTAGYRLVYEVIDDEIVVYVLAIGKRDKDAVYKKLGSRFR